MISALATFGVLWLQQQGSQQDKQDIMDELHEVKKERNGLRGDLEIRDARIHEQTLAINAQAVEIIRLNKELMARTDKLNDFITGGEGYPVVTIMAISPGSSIDGSFRFAVENITKLPLHSIKAFITDFSMLQGFMKPGPDGMLQVTFNDKQKAIVYTFNYIEDLPSESTVVSSEEFQNPHGLYLITLKSLNNYVFEKLAIVPEGRTAHWGYAIYSDKKNLLKTHFSTNAPEPVKSKILERFKEIDLSQSHRVVN